MRHALQLSRPIKETGVRVSYDSIGKARGNLFGHPIRGMIRLFLRAWISRLLAVCVSEANRLKIIQHARLRALSNRIIVPRWETPRSILANDGDISGCEDKWAVLHAKNSYLDYLRCLCRAVYVANAVRLFMLFIWEGETRAKWHNRAGYCINFLVT